MHMPAQKNWGYPMAPHLIGTSPAAARLKSEIDRAARSDAKVLITGESGVGKDIAARLIHAASQRHSMPLLSINCAGMPDGVLESELFGHVKGSFTGAYRDRPGLLQLAHRGTLFLDEVGETTARMQSALLRFLEAGELQRVGGTHTEARVDVRIIAATNRDLSHAVSSGQFREDFFYRLNVIRVHVTPLRERVEDIPLLLEHFTRAVCEQAGIRPFGYSGEAVDMLTRYRWPGNVRELKNVVERLMVRDTRIIEADDLPEEIARDVTPAEPPPSTRSGIVDDLFERISRDRESFWSVVYAPFMLRDLTRDDIRALILRGLQESGGDQQMLAAVFNLDDADYRRLLNFLRKHRCQTPLQPVQRGATVAPRGCC
jgi:transcriptional regulator with GAF, ATPase, and Fis domain